MKILIAEDEPFNQQTISEIMQDWGFEFDIANNGQQAFEYAQKQEYDLCVMDISMPVMNGRVATQIMRQRLSYLPIIAITGNPAFRDEYLAIGMDDCLQKPYDLEQLYAKIKQLTTKLNKLYLDKDKPSIKQEKPMDQAELQELIVLKKQGLTKLKLKGSNHVFVVHKNIQNKISYDFVGQGKEASEFIDRSEEEPGRCHLYRSNLIITKDLFTPDEFEEAATKEDEVAVTLNELIDQALKDEKS